MSGGPSASAPKSRTLLTDPDLADFFARLAPALVEARASLETLGVSSSGRLDIYRDLVLAQHHAALETSLPATRRALETARRGSFRVAADRHLERRRARGPHPSCLAEDFAATLAEMGSAPWAWAEELADLELLRGRMARAPRPRPETRFYRRDVVPVLLGKADVPPERPRALIVGRDPSHRVRLIDGTPPRLVALGLALGELSPGEIAHLSLSRAAVAVAQSEVEPLLASCSEKTNPDL